MLTAYLTSFRRFPTTFQRFPKISKDSTKFVRGSQERFRAFPKTSEEWQRFPKITKDSVQGRPEDVLIIHQRIKAKFKRQT